MRKFRWLVLAILLAGCATFGKEAARKRATAEKLILIAEAKIDEARAAGAMAVDPQSFLVAQADLEEAREFLERKRWRLVEGKALSANSHAQKALDAALAARDRRKKP